MNPDDFRRALAIGNVGVPKLTQTLFLIDAVAFMPFDEGTRKVLADRIAPPKNWESYRSAIDQFRAAFPRCELYEINLAAYLLHSDQISVSQDAYQVGTDVFGDGEDHWQEFVRANAVWTGGPGSGIGWWDHAQGKQPKRNYPLDQPERGDLIVVRQASHGRGVGIVYRNDYRNELSEQSKLHVVWLNKSDADLATTWTLQPGFGKSPAVASAFFACEAYRPTYNLLQRFGYENSAPQPKGTGGEPRTAIAAPAGPLNRILYGPPGTGKTWDTVGHALAVVDGSQGVHDHDTRRFQKLRFDPKTGSGNIAMVTFHQNFAYEDFVEGIRPVLDSAELRYELHDGLFKQLV